MRQLDTCDFCGDAAEGVYEVVPASVAGDSRRLALCADCRTTLQSVVDPLLDAVDADDSDSDARADATDGSDALAAASTGDDGDATAAATNASDATAAATDDSDAAADASGTATSDDADSEGVTIEVGGSDDDSGTETADGDADSEDDDAAGESRARRPSGYAQLIRLLQNRDGAMAREDLRALATNAYDIGSTEFEDALEAAVENGDVEETADGLRTA